MQKKVYLSYITKIGLTVAILLIPLLSNLLFLFNHRELTSVDLIVKKQLDAPETVAGLASQNLAFDYKLTLVNARRPEVLILGSSRALQFREAFFSTSMVSAGGAISSVHQGYQFLDQVLTKYKPKLIILCVDFWWFNEKMVAPAPLTRQVNSPRFSIQTYIQPFEWLSQGKISPEYYFQHLSPFNRSRGAVGLDSIMYQTGFRVDGSYDYTKFASGSISSHDERFSSTLELISSSSLGFSTGKKAHPQHIANFIALVNELEQSEIPYFIVFPPNASVIIDQMNHMADNYRYIDDLKDTLKSHEILFYDYSDPSTISASDCEFVDGVHGGDLAYARLLLRLSHQANSEALDKVINQSYLTEVTTRYHDITMLRRAETLQPEVDFLNLGCQKQNDLKS